MRIPGTELRRAARSVNLTSPPLHLGFLFSVVGFRSRYGNPEASAPSYELERIFPYLVTEDLPVTRLDQHSNNPIFDTPMPQAEGQPFTERYPWLLPAVVGFAALMVGLFLARLIR